MKLSFSVPDELYEKYVKKFGVAGSYSRMRKAIELFEGVDEKERFVFLAGDDRRAVEKIMQTTLDNGKQLAKFCERLSRVQIGDASVTFTTEELERLQMQATFHGKDMTIFIHDLAVEIKDRILEMY